MISLALYTVYTIVLLAVSYTDLKTMKILNKIIVPAIGLASIAMLFEPNGWQTAVQGALLGSGFLLMPVVTLGKKGGMGDVKMAFFMGLILGYPNIVWALLIAHTSAALLLIGVPFGWIDLKAKIPFAPFLALGTLPILTGMYLL